MCPIVGVRGDDAIAVDHRQPLAELVVVDVRRVVRLQLVVIEIAQSCQAPLASYR
jgi:hypothetical protein